MTKVYVVIEGDNSKDTHVTVYTDQGKAKLHETLSRVRCRVEEQVLNERDTSVGHWVVWMREDGKVPSTKFNNFDTDQPRAELVRAEVKLVPDEPATTILICECWARDEKDAIRITDEVREDFLSAEGHLHLGDAYRLID